MAQEEDLRWDGGKRWRDYVTKHRDMWDMMEKDFPGVWNKAIDTLKQYFDTFHTTRGPVVREFPTTSTVATQTEEWEKTPSPPRAAEPEVRPRERPRTGGAAIMG